jgi:uncharacterized membrane protein
MEEDYGSGEKGLDRILALSDGIFAFSLTLLALSLVVPQLTSGQSNAELSKKLAEEIPSFFVYFWSFFVVSFYWFAHHRVFRYIKRYDSPMMWFNLVFLMFITLVPFITNLMKYADLQLTVVIAAIFYSVPGFAISLLWQHSSKNHRLIDKGLSRDMIRLTRIRNYISPLVFIASIPFSYINPYFTPAFWLVMIPLRIVVIRKSTVHKTR